jgi:hypothetical protein
MPINPDGPIVGGTVRNLVQGLRSHPIPEEAIDQVLAQATDFTQRLVDTYCEHVAAGEVGVGGTGLATEEPILGTRAPRALLYGRIQSGKTVAMILTAAIALDNGFRVVVVLTTDNVALVRQTASRFKNLDGPRVFSAVKDGTSYEWEGQEDQLRDAVTTDGIILVCGKNAFNLPQVILFLTQLEAASYPVLVMDDEADAATPDTTIAARSAGKASAPPFASTINRLVIANDDPSRLGFSLGEKLPHSLYVQVTATPYVLLLQKADAEIRPTVSFLLNPGEGYCGGEIFFGAYDTESPEDPYPGRVVLVGDNEGASMTRRVPPGLARSIDFFILSSCARALTASWPLRGEGFKHLSHTSPRIGDHALVANHIGTHLNDLRTRIRDAADSLPQYFADMYQELQRSVPQCPTLEELIHIANAALRQTEIIRINSEGDVTDYGPRLNFVVGGNILGRGLTIENLLVTYYIREAKTSQMDTVWQHARMFGYRQPYLDFVRIFLPYRLGVRFREIHEEEESLREALRDGEGSQPIVIGLPRGTRPTRPNALEDGAVRTIPAARDQIHPYGFKEDAEAAAIVLALLKEQNVPISDQTPREEKPTRVPFEIANEIIRRVQVAEDDLGSWQEEIVLALLDREQDIKANGCTVYVRPLTKDSERTRSRLSGDEVSLIRTAAGGVPALALLYRGDPNAPIAWYPTLVMPSGAPSYVFSAT